MGRVVPVWLLLLCLLLGSLFTLFFGWSVNTTVSGSARFGRLGEVSVVVASFPDLVAYYFKDIAADPDAQLRFKRSSADVAGFYPVRMKPGINIQGLMMRSDAAALARASGLRILVGVFVIDGELNHAALALSPELEVVKVWVLREDGIDDKKPPPTGRKFIHGFALLRDGSMIVAWIGGKSLQRFDRCGRTVWSTDGMFDHAVSLEENERFVWTLSTDYEKRHEVVKVATATGEVVRRFSIASISAANPMIDILGVRQYENFRGNFNPRNMVENWQPDPFHVNDVEPLPAAIANRFETFSAGDLLLSARNLNLVFVVDPETLKVKWWQSGAWRRQHDADWQPTGEITVYDNRTDRDYSRIVSITPASRSTRVLFDGGINDFYSATKGNHQITKAGNILITSSRQARVFEVDQNGQPVFELINVTPRSKEFGYLVTDALWLPPEAFDFTKDSICAP